MKRNILVLLVLSVAAWFLFKPSPVTFSFAGTEWDFPSTIGEAVKKHDLLFKPPGYYYRVFPDEWHFPSTISEAVKKHDFLFKPPGYYYRAFPSGMKLELWYHSKWWELYNDNQTKETLYDKRIHTYRFVFPDNDTTYDSLRRSLEHQFKSKFVLKEGIRKDLRGYVPEEIRTYSFDFLTVNPSFVVCLTRRKSMTERNKKFIAVVFLYNLSEDEQVIGASNLGN